jgi:hypothetical protein
VALPDGVTLLQGGQIRYFTERQPGHPFVNCMLASLCTPLSYMGFDLPPGFVQRLRDATGVPDFDAKDNPQGTSTADSQRAVAKLFGGDLPGLIFGGLTDDDLLAGLQSGDFVARVIVSNQKTTPHVRRWAGLHWKGFHADAVGGARREDGVWKVLWMDPMGKGKYTGEWIAYDDIKDALQRMPNGKVKVTLGELNAALPDSVQDSQPPTHDAQPNVDVATTDSNSDDGDGTPKPVDDNATQGQSAQGGSAVEFLTNARLNELAHISKGTPFLHPETMNRVSSARMDGDFHLAGRSVDGKYTGVWVVTSHVPGARGLSLLLVETALIGAPFVHAQP